MELSTAEKEAEAEKAAATDAAAMDKLMTETLDQAPPPAEEPPPEPKEQPPPEPKHEEPPPPPKEEPPPPEPKAEPAKVEAKTTPELDDFEQDLASDKYNLPVGSTKKAQEVNKILRQKANDEHRLFRDLRVAKEAQDKEVETLKVQMAQAAKDKEDLDRFRPIVETLAIEQNPRFNQEFGQRMSRIENHVMTNLRSWGLEDATAKYIMEHGGPSYFSKDSVSTVEAEPEREGGAPVRMTHKDFWENRVLKQLNSDNRDSIRLAFDDVIRVKEARDVQLKAALSNREAYFKNLEAESKKNEESFKAACQKELDSQLKELGDIAKERPIPKDATPELRERLESYNAIVRDATAKFDPYFLDTSPKALVSKNLGGLLLAAMPQFLALKDAEIAEKEARYAALEKKWNASKNAANTSQRQSVQQQGQPEPEFERNDGRRMEQMMERLP